MCRALKINNLKYVFAQGNRCAPLNIFHLPPDCFRDRSQCWNIRLQPRQRALSVQPTASLFGHPAIPRFIDASQIPTFKKKKKTKFCGYLASSELLVLFFPAAFVPSVSHILIVLGRFQTLFKQKGCGWLKAQAIWSAFFFSRGLKLRYICWFFRHDAVERLEDYDGTVRT